MKKRVLCFGDSNTWGYNPIDGSRYEEDVRWPCLLQKMLGETYDVIEEGQNGRTFAVNDYEGGYMSAMYYIQPCLKSHDPLDLMIVMLGINDLKRGFGLSPYEITEGLVKLISFSKEYWRDFARKTPKVLIVSPPCVGDALSDSWDFDYENTIKGSRKLSNLFYDAAYRMNCSFIDAAEVVTVGKIDGLHLDEKGHSDMAKLIYEWISDNL